MADSQHEPGLTSHPPHHSRGPQASTPLSRFPTHLPLCACAFPSHFTDTAWPVSPTVSQAPNPTNYFQPSFPCPLPGVRLHGQATSSLVPRCHRRWTLPDSDSSFTVLSWHLIFSLLPDRQCLQPPFLILPSLLGVLIHTYSVSYHQNARIPTWCLQRRSLVSLTGT